MAISNTAFGEPIYEVNPDVIKVPLADQFYTATGESNATSIANTSEIFAREIRPSFEHALGLREGAEGPVSWKRSPTKRLDPPSGKSWAAISLKNPTNRHLNVMLELEGLGVVSWFIVDSRGMVDEQVYDIQADQGGRRVFDIKPVVPIRINASESVQVYVMLETAGIYSWNLDLWQEDAFREDRFRDTIIDGIYVGAVLTLLLSCFVVFLILRRPIYLLFALFLLGSASTVFIASGLYQLFIFTRYLEHGFTLLFLSTGAVDLFAALFSILLLKIHRGSRILFGAWLTVILANILNTVYAIYLVTTLDPSGLAYTSILVTLGEQLLFFWTLVVYWNKSRVARFWFLAIIIHSLGLILWTLAGNFPDAYAIEPKRIVQFAVLLDSILLSSILAYSFRIERSERLEAQDLSVENLRYARDLEQAKSNFIATVGHDLHGPVRAIGFFAESLRPITNEAGQLGLQRIEENVETVSALLDSLVRMAETESHRQLEISETDLAATFYTLKNEFEPLARAKGLQLVVPDQHITLRTDPVALSQILRNLIQNAIKYTHRGEVVVSLAETDVAVHVTVADTGEGIAPDRIEKVFDEFYQVSSNDSEGVGLGLSIVARLTQLLGIGINVSSTINKGSRFEIVIPRQARDVTMRDWADPNGLASVRDLTGVIVNSESPELAAVVGHLQTWGVTLVEYPDSVDKPDFYLVSEEFRTIRQVTMKAKDAWVLSVGANTGNGFPARQFVAIESNIEPMQLRAIMQRISKSRKIP